MAMTEAQLQRLLEATAASVSYPPAPDLRAAVLARLEPVRPAPRLRTALVVAALLLAILAATLIAPPSRDAIARFFGIQGSHIELLPGPPPTPFPRPAGLETQATPVALDAVAGAARPVVPDELRQAYVASYGGQDVVVLHYDGFDLWQTQLPIEANFGKFVPPGSEVRDVMVGPYDARWLTGEHFVYYSLNGRMVAASQRTVTRNTLVWRTPWSFYRLETSLDLADALRIARTLP
jgi:hypothetical protein